ncbi:hypothetical protein EC968_006125 [Mortierella alpina]|nr:hypothetical protein EC968_006125 [Mortierella alpina]
MTSDPSSRTHPLQLYEVLSLVLSFLDRPSLLQAGLVCSAWHTCSQPILQQTCAILNQDFLGFFSPPGRLDLSRATKLHAARFASTYHRVRSLRVGSILQRHDKSGGPFDKSSAPHLPEERMLYLFQLYRAYQVHPGLKHLVHLDIHFNSDQHVPDWRFADHDEREEVFYAIMYGLILDNEHLRDLEFTHVGTSSIATLYSRLCDLKVAQRVQRLSIRTDAMRFPILTLLADLRRANTTVSSGGNTDVPAQGAGAGAEAWTLQELVLHSVRSRAVGRLIVGAEAPSCQRYPGIRSLTLLDFIFCREVPEDPELETDPLTDTPAGGFDPKLYFMQQCPNLERLRISYDLSPVAQPCERSFSESVLTLIPELEDVSHWMEAPANFVEEMVKACPKLKAIDLGGNVDLSGTQWEEMMGVYGRQLESLVVWGAVNFAEEALLRLLESPPRPSNTNTIIAEALPRGFGATSRLTELDISWTGGVEICAWLVFSTLPCLKHFKARQVPLDAARLVGYDWVCKDLETLAIQVLVPMQKWPLEPVWVGGRIVEPGLPKENCGRDTKTPLSERDQISETSTSAGSKPSDNDNDADDDDDGYAEKPMSKRIRVQEMDKERKKAKKARKDRKRSTERKDKKERKRSAEGKDSKEARRERKERRKSKESSKLSKKRTHCQRSDDEDSNSDLEAQADASSAREQSKSTSSVSYKGVKDSEPPRPYHIQIQVDLCEQLGRLHRLRELTLEGQRDFWYHDREWDCMQLTLKTGLDRLEGLQNSLERLVVYQLQEELAGEKEVEWIAQHWVHHQNPAWQQDYRRLRQAFNDTLDDDEEEIADDLWRPEPKFKELLGVRVSGKFLFSSAPRSNSNLAWLKQECPRLRIEKNLELKQLETAFYVGNFEDY